MFGNRKREILELYRDIFLRTPSPEEILHYDVSGKSIEEITGEMLISEERQVALKRVIDTTQPLIDMPRDLPRSTELEWWDTDTEKSFNETLAVLGDEWRYAHEKITYKVNSLKYRSKEFDDIDWDNYMAAIGCSHTAAVGIALEKTWPMLLSNSLGMDLLNAGIPGGSNSLIVANLIKLLGSDKPNPKFITISWTAPQREAYLYGEKYHIYGSRLQKDSHYQRTYNEHLANFCNWDMTFIQQKATVDALCKAANIPVWHKSFFDLREFNPVLNNIDIINAGVAFDNIDVINKTAARDVQSNFTWAHPGELAQHKVLELFETKIKGNIIQ